MDNLIALDPSDGKTTKYGGAGGRDMIIYYIYHT